MLGTAKTNEKEANGYFFKILVNFLGVGQNFCDHDNINLILWGNGSSNFDNFMTNRKQIEASFNPEQFRRHKKSFIFFDAFGCPQL
jgi:hypothetical protein